MNVDDICNVLLAANKANEAIMEEIKKTTMKEVINELGLYYRGYRAALTTVALALGLSEIL